MKIFEDRFIVWEKCSDTFLDVFGHLTRSISFVRSYTFETYEEALDSIDRVKKSRSKKYHKLDFYVIPYTVTMGFDMSDEKSLLQCKLKYPT